MKNTLNTKTVKTGNSNYDNLPSKLKKVGTKKQINVDALRKKFLATRAKKDAAFRKYSEADQDFYHAEAALENLLPSKPKSGKVYGDPCVSLEF